MSPDFVALNIGDQAAVGSSKADAKPVSPTSPRQRSLDRARDVGALAVTLALGVAACGGDNAELGVDDFPEVGRISTIDLHRVGDSDVFAGELSGGNTYVSKVYRNLDESESSRDVVGQDGRALVFVTASPGAPEAELSLNIETLNDVFTGDTGIGETDSDGLGAVVVACVKTEPKSDFSLAGEEMELVVIASEPSGVDVKTGSQ